MKLQTDPICPPIHCSSSTQEMSIIRHQLDQAVIYTLSSTDMHSFTQTHTWFTALKQVGLSFSLLSLLPVVWASSKSREKRLRLSLSLSLYPWIFNLSPLLMVVICSAPQMKQQRQGATTSGPQEDVLTPLAVSPLHQPSRTPSSPSFVSCCLNSTRCVLEGAEGPVARETIQ